MIPQLMNKLFYFQGWKVKNELPETLKKAIVICVPHTSNWDFPIAIAAFHIMKKPIKFTIKKEWLVWPFKKTLQALGAIPIDRHARYEGRQKLSNTTLMINLLNEKDELLLLVTPEATRKFTKRWKSGFYYAALNAKVPIVLGYLDYSKKVAGLTSPFTPTGNYAQDIEQIMKFYRTITPKFPTNFNQYPDTSLLPAQTNESTPI